MSTQSVAVFFHPPHLTAKFSAVWCHEDNVSLCINAEVLRGGFITVMLHNQVCVRGLWSMTSIIRNNRGTLHQDLSKVTLNRPNCWNLLTSAGGFQQLCITADEQWSSHRTRDRLSGHAASSPGNTSPCLRNPADFLKLVTKCGRNSVIYIWREGGLAAHPPLCAMKRKPLDCQDRQDRQELRRDLSFYREKLMRLQPVNALKCKSMRCKKNNDNNLNWMYLENHLCARFSCAL